MNQRLRHVIFGTALTGFLGFASPACSQTPDERLNTLVLNYDREAYKTYFNQEVNGALLPLKDILAPAINALRMAMANVGKHTYIDPWGLYTPGTQPESRGTVYLSDIIDTSVTAHYRALGRLEWAQIENHTDASNGLRMHDLRSNGYGTLPVPDVGIIRDITVHERGYVDIPISIEYPDKREHKPALVTEFAIDDRGTLRRYRALAPIHGRESAFHAEITDRDGSKRPYAFGHHPVAMHFNAVIQVYDPQIAQERLSLEQELTVLQGTGKKNKVEKLKRELATLDPWVTIPNPFIVRDAPKPKTQRIPGFCGASCDGTPGQGYAPVQIPSDPFGG